jgi:hypothetical protein
LEHQPKESDGLVDKVTVALMLSRDESFLGPYIRMLEINFFQEAGSVVRWNEISNSEMESRRLF